ncbi:unnamed protein product, partial [Musa acuminata subsp. burmannicoides]
PVQGSLRSPSRTPGKMLGKRSVDPWMASQNLSGEDFTSTSASKAADSTPSLSPSPPSAPSLPRPPQTAAFSSSPPPPPAPSSTSTPSYATRSGRKAWSLRRSSRPIPGCPIAPLLRSPGSQAPRLRVCHGHRLWEIFSFPLGSRSEA